LKIRPQFISIFIICHLIGCNTGISNEKNKVVFDRTNSLRYIYLKKNDSLSIQINLDSSLGIKSILELKKGIIDGQSLVFYPSGQLQKKVQSVGGVREGHTQYFYESGALWRDLYYYFGKPHTYAAEYWDGNYGITKYSIHFGERGKILKIKTFDSLGYFLKDSIPSASREYPEIQ
jgi:antitoxin component YwqK of YwqJK toxin-antitoxin module